MNAGRKDQEQAQAAAAQSGLRPSRPPTFDQRMQAVEDGIEKLAEMIEDYKRCYRSTEPEPQAKTPKHKAANAPVNAPASAPANAPASAPVNAQTNTLGKKATNANGKEPRVKKPTSTESMAPTSYQAMVKPKIEASLTVDLTPTIKAIEKMWQPKHQVPPKKIKLSSQSEAPLKIRLELEGSEGMSSPKMESVESTSTQAMPPKKIKESFQSEAPRKIRLELEGSEGMSSPKMESVESTSTQAMAPKKIKESSQSEAPRKIRLELKVEDSPQKDDDPANNSIEMLQQE